MIDHRKWVHVSMFKYVCGKGRDAFENVPLIASRGIPACSEYLEVGGALQSHAKGTPHCLQAPLYSPFLTSRAYEWPEYNKRCFFSFSPSLLQALLYPSEDFWECNVCVFVWVSCVWVLERKRVRALLWMYIKSVCTLCVCVSCLEFVYVCMNFSSASTKCVDPMWNRISGPRGLGLAWVTNPGSCELSGVWNSRTGLWEISFRSLTLSAKDTLSCKQ